MALLIFICLSCTNEQITEQTNEAIKNSPELKQLDKVCTQIPLLADFQFVQKGGIDDQKISLSYKYNSETRYEEFWKVLKNYFEQNNWKLVKEGEGTISSIKIIEFTNEKFRVVQHKGMRSVDYGIYCEKFK